MRVRVESTSFSGLNLKSAILRMPMTINRAPEVPLTIVPRSRCRKGVFEDGESDQENQPRP
jgi:hypothetical protein